MTKNHPDKYSSLSIGLHWLMLLLFIAVYALIELRGIYPKGSEPREAMKALHFSFGLSIFALVWVRLIARFVSATPLIQPALPRWQQQLSIAVHLLLYALMIAMPLLGWIGLSAAGKPIPFFNLQLPALIAENKELAKQVMEIHETVGTAGYFLIGVHTIAALYHHYIARDNTLRRMLPLR